MLELNNGVTLINPIRRQSTPGLGERFYVRYDNLLTGRDHTRGPFASNAQLIADIEGYAEHNKAFNIYSAGRYVGGTEV